MSIRKGNTIIAGNIDAVYETDEQTITINQDEKLQVIGTINKNTLMPKYDWVGTKAEYNGLGQIHDDWLYFITDDTKETITLSNCVGQIIQAMCTSSYIPNGCIPCDGTEYTADRFIDFWTNYLTSQPSKILTCTYNEYNTEITTYGQCAKFAIDTSSQKFKAPTIKDGSFIQQAMSDTELGKAYNAGLPNITGQLSHAWAENNDYSCNGAFYRQATSASGVGSSGASASYRQMFDASRSNSIYGNSTTVQPNAVALRFFVVVVDTYLNQSQLDWTTYTQSLNNKADKNLVNTGLITNCITEIPQDIKLELNDGILTLKAGSKIYMPAGFETDGTTKKFTNITTLTDLTTTSEYNGDIVVYISHMTTSPVLTLAALNSDTGSGTGTGTGYYYSTDYNKIYVHAAEYDGCSFPIAIIKGTSVKIVSIDKIFNGFGYIGYTVFVLPGVKGLCPAGKNEYGALLSQSFTTESVKVYTFSNNYTGTMTLAFNGTTFHADCIYYYERANRPSGENCCWLDLTTNTFNVDYWNGSVDNYYFDIRNCLIFTGHRTANARIDEANFKQPTKLIDYSSTDFIIAYKRPTSTDPTWYRLYKSGWVEQGGKINSVTAYNTTVIKNLIIPMSDTNYSISGVMHTNGAGSYYYNTIVIRPESASTFRIGAGCSESFILTWEAKGFAAGY